MGFGNIIFQNNSSVYRIFSYNSHLLTVLPRGYMVYTDSGSVISPKDGSDGILSHFDGAFINSDMVHFVHNGIQYDCHATGEFQFF